MGSACSSSLTAFSFISKAHTAKVLILGKQGAGKTFLLYSWKYGVDSILSVEPTNHFNVDTVTTQSSKKILVYDLAGNIGLRMRPFLEGTNGVIYMLGLKGADNFLLEEEVLTLQQLLQEKDMENVPLLFVLRKEVDVIESNQDLPDKLQKCLKNRPWELVEIRSFSQEDSNRVLKVLENLLNCATVITS